MSNKIIATFIIVFVFTGIAVADDSNELNYKPGELIVRFAPKAKGIQRSKDERKAILASIKGGTVKHSFKRTSGLTVVKLPKNTKVKDKIKAFKNRKDILYAEPNYKIRLLSTVPDDTHFDNLWGMHNTGQTSGTADADIDAPEAWDIATNANDIIVAVLDSGIDYDHEDLAANMWVNSSEATGDLNSDGYPGVQGVDDDGDGLIDEDSQDRQPGDAGYTNDLSDDDDENGYIDDIYGWDFADNDSNPDDYLGHGTHVAGTIGAVGNNDKGVAGVCWNAKILSLKIFPNYGEEGFIDGAIDAIEYAVDMGAKVLNNSWGGGSFSQSLKNAIDDAEDAGVLFIAAAGNDGVNNDISLVYPTNYDSDNIISVMATDHNDDRSVHPGWWASNYGATKVDLAAPGSDIYSCIPDDQYDSYYGTSMAAPHVAGACALLWAKYPYLTHLEVKAAILNTVDKPASLEGLCVSDGRLNLYRALSETFPLKLEIDDDIDPNSCGVDPTDPNNNTITYTLTVTHEGIDPNDPNDPNNNGDIEYTLVDYLPSNIDPVNVTVTGPGSYSMFGGTVTWEPVTLSPGDSNSFTVTITILEGVEPRGEIKNDAEVFALDTSITATVSTPVCCYGGDIIYVDSKAQGRNVGLSWNDAYTDLSSALNRAAKGCGNEIRVAGGVYTPTNTGDASISFELADDVEVYGGFIGNETSRSQRDFVRNKTYLSGDISATDNDPNSDYVVSAGDGVSDAAILDGFVICRGVKAGIHLYDQGIMDDLNDPNTSDPNCDISPNIVNCYITNNDGDGIHGQLADPNIYACIIADNGGYGIVDANSFEVNVDRCVIRNNTLAGINARAAHSGRITNCFIYQNGDGILCYGINETEYVTIRNNTIVYNDGLAVEALVGSTMPVVNSILWGNSDPNQIVNCLPDRCFIDVGTVSEINYNTDPGFAYTEPNACNYHLAADSNCIDAGLTAGIPAGEKDIDGEVRVYTSLVDIGADEVGDCDDVVSSVDHNGDGIVNLIEFSLLANAWMTYDPCTAEAEDPNFFDDYNSDNYDSRCDYEDDSMINILDLQEFASDWLWAACWRDAATGTWLEAASTGSSSLQVPGTTSTAMAMSVSSLSMTAKPVTPELSPAAQLLQAAKTLDFLNMIYEDELNGQINQKTWKEFMDHLEGWVDGLAEDYLKSTE